MNMDLYSVIQTENKTPKVNKFCKKKKSKVMVMKKRTHGYNKTKRKIREKNGIIHFAKTKREPSSFMDQLRKSTKESISSKNKKSKISSSVTSRKNISKLTNSLKKNLQNSSQNRYISPISERLILNQQKPYIFIGNASYTKKSPARSQLYNRMINQK
mmetsp:Transcript_24/g.17  ORF Transcript_24/g.17 Transcript_24/m.17 type:complete len:158 (+) Transcript_24:507-980(+)